MKFNGYVVYTLFMAIFVSVIIGIPYFWDSFPKACETGFTVFKPTCHQLPERSFFIFGHQMPVCSRCFGFYLGMLVAALLFPAFRKIDEKRIPHIVWLIAACAPMGIDGGSQLAAQALNMPVLYWLHVFGLNESMNWIRFITGLLAGGAISFYAIPILNGLFENISNTWMKKK